VDSSRRGVNSSNTFLETYFIAAILIFEIGGLICVVAQGPTTLIVGRAIAGVGGLAVAIVLFFFRISSNAKLAQAS
jgi:MFS family permease